MKFVLPFLSILPLLAEPLFAQETGDYYARWLNQDVGYIINSEERAVFEKLTTEEEKTAFIEQFWARRDPTPGTAENEFKSEHYRRIQFANERFTSGYDGWRTDRGRIYIMFGPPDQIEEHHGGRYDRPYYEGGGTTAAFPFQIWRYRHVKGIGDDVEIEFVDTSETGDYRIAIDEQEKDVFLTTPGTGLTLDEQAGRLTKGERIDNRMLGNPTYFKYMREKDLPFSRLYLRAGLNKPPAVESKLREEVAARVIYTPKLPFKHSIEILRLNEEHALVLVNIEISNHDLTYKGNPAGIDQATVEIYGLVQSMTGRVAGEFEQQVFAYRKEPQSNGTYRAENTISLFQRQLLLAPGNYKVDLIVKDRNSGEMGTQTLRLVVPTLHNPAALSFSTLILCLGLVPLAKFPERPEMFVIGDLKVWPSVDHRFEGKDQMGIYLQVYDFSIDQAALQAALSVRYEVLRGEQIVKSLDDPTGQSVGFVSGQRAVLTNGLKMNDLAPGEYMLRIIVNDQISGRSGQIRSRFHVTSEGRKDL